ncbi:MAG: DUF1292 domain-containing protein [Lachnospiraceae bacterium]|nr:DUF1292 domain-containing protein [Lachnospiraceae bacterium]
MMDETIILTTEDGEEVEFFVIEETRIAGINYLLVSDSETEDGDAYILKDTSDSEDSDALYEMVEDDEELSYLSKIFNELLGDEDIELVP